MPLDFPNSPTNGQIFSSCGMLWRYDGTKWVQASGVLALPDAPSDGNTYGRKSGVWNSVDAMLAPVAANANAALNDTGRNLIHNPTFTVQQRGTGSWTTGYTADRWLITTNTDTDSVSIQNLNDTDRAQIGNEAAVYCLQNVVNGNAAAGAFSIFMHRIENGCRRLSGKQAVVSFWAKSASGSPNIGVSLDQQFGSGGSPSADVNGNGTAVAINTTWARYSVAFTVPSTAGKTFGTNGDDRLQLDLWLSAGSSFAARSGIGVQSNTFSLWGVQLEIGTVATPLAKRDPAEELALCQRFYFAASNFLWSGYGTSGNSSFYGTTCFPVVMRASPSVVITGTNGFGNAAAGTLNSATPSSATFQSNTGSASPLALLCLVNFTASADL